MNHLQVTAGLKIHEGKREEFKALAEQRLAVVKEKNQNSPLYNWFNQ